MRAILAAAARGEEKPMEHHADTRVRLPIALWIRPPRACSMRPRWKISASTSTSDEASASLSIAKLPRNFLKLHR